MGAGEDLVNNAANAAENPVNDATGTTENSITNTGDSSENAENAVDVENHTKDQINVAENPTYDQAGCAANPRNDQKCSEEYPAKDDAGDDSTKDQVGGAENPVDDQEGDAENPLNDTAGGTEDIVNDKTGGAETETPINDQLNVAENPANDQAGGAANLVNEQACSAEYRVKEEAGDDSTKDQEGGAENSVNDTSGGSDNFMNNEAHAAENSTNDIAGDYETENSMNDKTGDDEIPVNNNDNAVENSFDDEQDDAENLVDTIDTLSNSEDDDVETPVSSKIDRLPEEAQEILISMAGKWEDVLDASALQVIPLKGAMTNEVFQIKWPATTGENSRKVLVRIYGEGVDIFFDRDDEIRTFEYMSKNGQGPRLLGRFTNGRVEEFIHARTLSASDLRDPSISALIAAKMKEFHDLAMPGEKKVNLWRTLRTWLSEAKRLSSPKEVEAFYLDTVDKEISILEKELSGAHQRIGFCHNDLQYGNIMLDEETNSVTIIDYEYASYNPVAYDIANHFCEMAANYHTKMPHILDYNKYPDFQERELFIRAYLWSSGEQPSVSEVEHLLQEVEKYTLANHLFWGLWGIISGQVNTIEFDYKEYAKQRFQEYWARKPYLLSSDAPSPFNVPEGTGELASVVHARGTKNTGIFRKMKRVLGVGLFRSKS
ncbi:probable choline kinase 2 [Cicer arietinum]|uniref:Probable choline kinase 2 n=1 Tax=Cicer arietinum TaxID=3827 RepID=A0A1S2Y5L8_CICAR|nr:probable choline kinase 2 [Cicer arietinum]